MLFKVSLASSAAAPKPSKAFFAAIIEAI